MGMKPEDIELLQNTVWSPQARVTTPNDPDREIRFLSTANLAGVRVNQDTALQVSAIWACVVVISNALAASDWNVLAKTSPTVRTRLDNDRIQYLLNVRPNEEMTAKQMKQAWLISAVLAGNGYLEIARDRANRPAALWPISWDRVDPKRDPDGTLWWRVPNDDSTEVRIEHRNMLHLAGPGVTGLLGDAVIARGAATFALAIAAESFASAYFGNGTTPGILLEPAGVGAMDDTTYNRLKQQFEGRHRGPGRSFRFGVLEGGMKIHQLKITAQEAQMTEGRKHQIEEICRWFGVPPHKVAHLVHSTLSNIEHLGMEFARDTLRPWARGIQEEATYKLFGERETAKYVHIDLDWASQGDFQSRTVAYRNMREMGAYSVNDILIAEGKNTIGPAGDIRVVTSASIRLEDVGKNYDTSNSEPKREPPPSPDTDDEDDSVSAKWLVQIFDRCARRVANREAQGHSKSDAMSDALTYFMKEITPFTEAHPNLSTAMLSQSMLLCVNNVLTPTDAARDALRSIK